MKVAFVSLGCDKNLSDSEHMLYRLQKAGMELVADEKDADVAVVNTCCFIESALQESIDTILEVAKYKTQGNLKGLLVAGCMSERYADEIKSDLPEVDGIIGTNSYDSVVEAIEKIGKEKNISIVKPLTGLPDESVGRVNATGGVYDYLKIAEGCDKHCTYCIIPSLRGNYRSVPMEQLLEEARDLAKNGIQELILVAQETTLYGTDLYGEKKLPELLDRLNEIPELKWIRILYSYPEEIDDALIAAMKRNEKVCHYIDMPIQHADDFVLRRMGRRTSNADIRNKINALREAMPDIAIRTSLIAGFPGETEEMHQEMLTFLKDMNLDRVGVFTYSKEDGTPAATFENQLSEETKEKWRDEIMTLQQGLVFRTNRSLVGKQFDVFVEGYMTEEDVYVGRTYRDAPGVDGLVFFSCEKELISGTIVPVQITGVNEYDLIGEVIL
ncbi:MAG: 30S ribosomal protein S12 methylthiotransferase RimO [Lachnospiraceae bacterium]|nr:30S ribosomal protein S12 methylthiotransferase RimO [Lachnospiraceae bacterium]